MDCGESMPTADVFAHIDRHCRFRIRETKLKPRNKLTAAAAVAGL